MVLSDTFGSGIGNKPKYSCCQVEIMDIATVIGLVGTLGLIAWAMNSAAGLGAFIDPASVVIVFVGSIMVLLMRSTLPEFINAWAKVLMKTILNSN
ncbi:MAG TPA: hypothetical protein DEQ32_03505, partial [Gammaproteobacteria bacterium]|nr:hypothetical protein [Gammaproteobacteria bacterium]